MRRVALICEIVLHSDANSIEIELKIVKLEDWCSRLEQSKCQLIFFPELSLTGYEPTLAKKLALQLKDSRLNVLRALSEQYNIIVGVGLPIQGREGVPIGMAIFNPDGTQQLYCKRHLHRDEAPYFVNDREDLNLGGRAIAPAMLRVNPRGALGQCHKKWGKCLFCKCRQIF